MSIIKEPHFWTDPRFCDFTTKNFEEYFSLFKNENVLFGESSTGYLFFDNFIENINENYYCSPKFIILLRNPIDRIYSHYHWLKGVGSEYLELKKAILNDKDLRPDQSKQLPEHYYKNYFQFGLYGERIQKFLCAFGKENIHIITTEELHSNRLKTVNSCFTFLNLVPLKTIPEIKVNETVILRFPWLYKNIKRFFLNKSRIKDVLKVFFPEFIRKKMNKSVYPTIYKLTTTSKKPPRITQEERSWIKNLYLEDVSLLKKVTGKQFNEWQDFKNV